jgi:hypothetical protein
MGRGAARSGRPPGAPPLRVPPLLLTASIAVAALALVPRAGGLAFGEPPPGGGDPVAALAARVEGLELQVKFLESREAAVSAYVLRNEERAEALERAVAAVRAAGFTMAAIPPRSRELLLEALERAAQSLKADLPRPTKDELEIVKELARRRKAGVR